MSDFKVGDKVYFYEGFRLRYATIRTITTLEKAEKMKPIPHIWESPFLNLDENEEIALFRPSEGKGPMVGISLRGCYASVEELKKDYGKKKDEERAKHTARKNLYKERLGTKEELARDIIRYLKYCKDWPSNKDSDFEDAVLERACELFKGELDRFAKI